MPYTSQ